MNVNKTLMGTVENNGGSKFIANLKSKPNRIELKNVLDKYNIPDRLGAE